VTGRPAQFGRGVIAEVGGKLVEQFAANLAQMISEGGGEPAADAPAVADAADAGPADAGPGGSSSADVSSVASPELSAEAGPASAESASAAPPPVRTATARPAAPDQDSINLVRLVAPALLKRVLPVAAGIAALALLGRRWRHLLHRGESGKKA
jgi:uncharacterized protein